jgi:hypothetical protein
MNNVAAPNDSRYVPFTQQSNCCVPTSIQMIMYRNGIPLIPAEELGYHLGLTVSPEEKHLFYDVRVADEPPSAAGYGTQIFRPEFEPNAIFKKLGIPLNFSLRLADQILDEQELLSELREIEESDLDALLCFNHGVIRGQFEPHSGHVAVFDRVIDNKVRLVDASPHQPKWRLVEPGLLFDAIKRHGNKSSGGVWRFTRA